MAANSKIAEPETNQSRRHQFRLRSLLIVVTLFGLLSGAIRWLFILAGIPVAVGVLIIVWFAASSVYGCARGLWLWRQWCRTQSVHAKAREAKAARVLLELEAARKAILAAKGDRLRNSNDRPAP